MNKSAFLQIRLTPMEKRLVAQKAKNAGMEMSAWVKSCIFSSEKQQYVAIIEQLSNPENSNEALASLNDFLSTISKKQFQDAVSPLPEKMAGTFMGNYIASMVELAAHQKNVNPPPWTQAFQGLDKPHFSSSLPSLRLHLLQASPVPFKRRNIFIDSSVGDRV
jgi:uncharacterized protein (DUF1778 family)